MSTNKNIKQIYREKVGKEPEESYGIDEGFGLAVYIEAPTKDYIKWLEGLALRSLENIKFTL